MSNSFSYSAIHTFTVVAQTLSFSRAATILHITPSAISHQMKLLESQLQVSLFIRQSKGVQLTDAGRALVKQASKGVALIQDGVAKSISTVKQRTLHIAAIPSLAQSWLLPRLTAFYDMNPDINIVLHAQDQLIDFSASHIDAHLHFGAGHYPHAHAQFLSHEYIYPVCHPDILNAEPKKALPELIEHYPLLQYGAGIEDAPSNITWQDWFLDHQISIPNTVLYRHFSHVNLALEAAKHKQGLALAWFHIAFNDLEKRILVPMDNQAKRLNYGYYLVSDSDLNAPSDLHIFSSWLQQEFKRSTLKHFNHN